MEEWYKKPTVGKFFEAHCKYVAFIDECGTGNMKGIAKALNNNIELADQQKYFALSAIIMNKTQFANCVYKAEKLKNKYWINGQYDNKAVCFHTYEINSRKKAFSNNVINYDEFIKDLSIFIEDTDCKIITIFVDKEKMYKKYGENTLSLYEYCTTCLIERISYLIGNDNITLMFEARGHKDDKKLLKFIKQLILKGNEHKKSETLKAQIYSVFFNPKWDKNNTSHSYIGLEIADLCVYTIFQHCVHNKKRLDFDIIENKIYGYPNYDGRGIKLLP